MRQLVLHITTNPHISRKPIPKRLNILDQEPPNALERQALRNLNQQAAQSDTNAVVLQELIARMARTLESYRSHYPPPIN